MSNVQQKLIGTRKASELLGESVKNTIRRVDSGQLPFVTKLPGLRGAYLFDESAVKRLVDELAAVSPADSAPEAESSVERAS